MVGQPRNSVLSMSHSQQTRLRLLLLRRKKRRKMRRRRRVMRVARMMRSPRGGLRTSTG